jgi:predicted phage terminase large subunit-like protein
MRKFDDSVKQDMEALLELQTHYQKLLSQDKAKTDFLSFVHHVWDGFVSGGHHKIVAEKLNAVVNGEIKRLIVNMPPRHTKSEFASIHFPAWYMGNKPKAKIMQTTHTGELAVGFGRKVRNLIDSDEFKEVFPDVTLNADNKSAGRWSTNKGGEYFAAGVGGAVTGRGADLLIIDDPHSEQDALSPNLLEHCWEWYTSGPRQRLQPGGTIVVVMTRWSTLDLTAKLLKAQGDQFADQWEVIEFPAIMPDDEPLWKEFWKKEELLKVKASLPVSKWNAQWMQNPTAEEGAIIKREWWNVWKRDSLPPVDYIIQSYDTAFSKKETADYSAITTWGIFTPEEGSSRQAIILLDARKGRWDFPELKLKAYEEYKYWEPEMVLIEAKASGMPLTHELRQIGIPVVNYTPVRGQDKIARVHAVSPVFESGMVWAPEKKFADEVIEECASFPYGEHDDYVDSMTQAIMRFREGGFIRLDTDEEEDDTMFKRVQYY